MTARPTTADLAVGESIGSREISLDRDRLVRYAGASGDFNPIHYSDTAATRAGLPGVVAHGMLTMGAAVALVADWAGDPAAVVDYRVRFTRPVPVPEAGAAVLRVTGVVGAVDTAAGTVRIDLAVTHDGAAVLGRATAVVGLTA